MIKAEKGIKAEKEEKADKPEKKVLTNEQAMSVLYGENALKEVCSLTDYEFGENLGTRLIMISKMLSMFNLDNFTVFENSTILFNSDMVEGYFQDNMVNSHEYKLQFRGFMYDMTKKHCITNMSQAFIELAGRVREFYSAPANRRKANLPTLYMNRKYANVLLSTKVDELLYTPILPATFTINDGKFNKFLRYPFSDDLVPAVIVNGSVVDTIFRASLKGLDKVLMYTRMEDGTFDASLVAKNANIWRNELGYFIQYFEAQKGLNYPSIPVARMQLCLERKEDTDN